MIRFDRLKGSFSYASQGWRFAFNNDQNLRIHIVIALVVLLAAFFLKLSLIELSIIIAMITLVFAAELMNTAIERVVDLITKERREDAKFAKDVSSAMVLTVAIASVVVGVIIFLPHIQ
ncbi:MAG: diacylglycerol kinase family protein [Candidatus Levybacteria bacterium]|nr:diacylglycerol kinase family protein [Candidatus Levybacteria bacterium]